MKKYCGIWRAMWAVLGFMYSISVMDLPHLEKEQEIKLSVTNVYFRAQPAHPLFFHTVGNDIQQNSNNGYA